MSYSWSRQWKTLWNHDGDKYQKACVDAWTQVADAWTQTTDDTARRAYDVRAPYSRNCVFSDQEIFDACCSRNPVVPCYPKRAQTANGPCQRMPALPPPGLPSTPHSSWQTYTDAATQHDAWVFRPPVPGPPDEPLTLKPYVPEIIHHVQHGPPPQRLHQHRSDHEILTNFDEDVSSICDGFSAWVESNAAEKRSRHLANSSPSGTALVFRRASEKKSMSQLLEYQFDNRKPNRQGSAS